MRIVVLSNQPNHSARFVTGSLMRHIIVMSSASAIGLFALFFVDLMDMYFISLLGKEDLAAAIGFAGTMVFFNMSVSLGFSIAMAALVARALGAGDVELAKKRCTNILILSFIGALTMTTIVISNLDRLLDLLGAHDFVAEKAHSYLSILMPSAPILAMAMSAGAALRAKGDPKNSMVSILLGGVTNAILDPVLIFGFDMGIEGAAWASVCSRFSIFIYSFYILCFRYRMIDKLDFNCLKSDIFPITIIAIPAIISNFATPLGNAFVIKELAVFGDDFVAGFAVIGRIIPIAFALTFALPGALGPIVGQNYGAGQSERVRSAFYNAIGFVTVYCVCVVTILWFLKNTIATSFGLKGNSYDIVIFFFTWISLFSIFNGLVFIANAVLNNLEKPLWATYINVAKATLGTIPFVMFGATFAGVDGVFLGQGIGSVIFGIAACIIAFLRVNTLCFQIQTKKEEDQSLQTEPILPMTPFCSSRAYMFEESEVCKQKLAEQEHSSNTKS